MALTLNVKTFLDLIKSDDLTSNPEKAGYKAERPDKLPNRSKADTPDNSAVVYIPGEALN